MRGAVAVRGLERVTRPALQAESRAALLRTDRDAIGT
jgi:hypothetical protein